MATDMGAVLKAMGFTEQGASDLATQISMLAVDVGSFNNLPSADVADRFTRALTGGVRQPERGWYCYQPEHTGSGASESGHHRHLAEPRPAHQVSNHCEADY